MLNFIQRYASGKVEKSLHKALNLKAPSPSLQLRKATANSVLHQCVLFVFPLSLFYSLFSVLFSTFCFHSFFFYLSMPSPKFLILFLPSILLYLFIPCPLTYPYTFPASYLFLLLSFSPSSVFLLLTHCALLLLLSIIFSSLFFTC